jgi:hypothetical protein
LVSTATVSWSHPGRDRALGNFCNSAIAVVIRDGFVQAEKFGNLICGQCVNILHAHYISRDIHRAEAASARGCTVSRLWSRRRGRMQAGTPTVAQMYPAQALAQVRQLQVQSIRSDSTPLRAPTFQTDVLAALDATPREIPRKHLSLRTDRRLSCSQIVSCSSPLSITRQYGVRRARGTVCQPLRLTRNLRKSKI